MPHAVLTGGDRRFQGRPKNVNKPPKTTSMKVYAATKDRIDRLWPYHRMPLGDKLDSILDAYERLRMLNIE